jgi:hypothetical protein
MGGGGGKVDIEVFNPLGVVPIFGKLWNCDVVFSGPFRRICGSLLCAELAPEKLYNFTELTPDFFPLVSDFVPEPFPFAVTVNSAGNNFSAAGTFSNIFLSDPCA